MQLRLVLFIVFTAILPAAAFSQESSSAVSSAVTNTDRYQILQSELAAKYTFRLDRFCGNLSQLVSDKDSNHSWETMEILSPKPCAQDGKAHYQLFMSGLAAKFTFLMNTATGETWQLVTSDQNSYAWQRIP